MRPELFDIDTALLTAQAVVRRFREGDGPALAELVRQYQAVISDLYPPILNDIQREQHPEVYARQKLTDWLLQRAYTMGVWDETPALLGIIQLHHIDWDTPRAELSFFLDPEQRDSELATEILARVVQFAFRQLQLEKLSLHTLIDDYTTQRLVRKVGFSREGDLRNAFRRPSGNLVDLMRFGLAREVYGR